MNKKKVIYRFEQLFILIVHLLLLAWIVYVLRSTGEMELSEVLLHFTGLALAGGGLIRGTAWWAHKHYLKEISGPVHDNPS